MRNFFDWLLGRNSPHRIGRLSFWSLNRDQQFSSSAIAWVDNTSSSLVQQPYEFSRIFNAITGP
jgi:hypothetical protein